MERKISVVGTQNEIKTNFLLINISNNSNTADSCQNK